MKLLVVCPDYASHALPMIEVAKAWSQTQGDAIVATGEATRPLVEAAGLTWIELRLGKGNNGGVIEADKQPVGEDDHLRAFFDATRAGPVATLRYQADARRHDLLHEPDRVLDRLTEIMQIVEPDRVVVDHVAFGARLALHALGIEPATMVLGHPSALSAPGEVYGLPPSWPKALQPEQVELDDLSLRCHASVEELSVTANEVLARRAPGRAPIGDLTSLGGHPTIYVYPAALHDPARPLPAKHIFIGSLARVESLGDCPLPTGSGPRVTVALGSFLSARSDVLAAAVAAAHRGGWRLALAHGSTPLEALGPVLEGAVVGRHLPQVALLSHTDVFIHHGGNGSVTEAATAGVPTVVLPFSTDQFAGAAAIERTSLGLVLAPNKVTADQLMHAVTDVLVSDATERAKELAASILSNGGAAAAVRAIAAQNRRKEQILK
jgi:zeaxanthin glucosyltransferase